MFRLSHARAYACAQISASERTNELQASDAHSSNNLRAAVANRDEVRARQLVGGLEFVFLYFMLMKYTQQKRKQRPEKKEHPLARVADG
jgi:hypothetical protein